jgi:hypothetical protein
MYPRNLQPPSTVSGKAAKQRTYKYTVFDQDDDEAWMLANRFPRYDDGNWGECVVHTTSELTLGECELCGSAIAVVDPSEETQRISIHLFSFLTVESLQHAKEALDKVLNNVETDVEAFKERHGNHWDEAKNRSGRHRIPTGKMLGSAAGEESPSTTPIEKKQPRRRGATDADERDGVDADESSSSSEDDDHSLTSKAKQAKKNRTASASRRGGTTIKKRLQKTAAGRKKRRTSEKEDDSSAEDADDDENFIKIGDKRVPASLIDKAKMKDKQTTALEKYKYLEDLLADADPNDPRTDEVSSN